jgi:phage-related protein
MLFKVVFADENGTVAQFEDWLIGKAEQSYRIGKNRIWIELAEIYTVQKRRLQSDPYPVNFNFHALNDENQPVIKQVTENTRLEQLYRWGIKFGLTGNHRFLYTIHNYHKVVLLHYFNKQYNGTIKQEDIRPAEQFYFHFLEYNPSLYPIERE